MDLKSIALLTSALIASTSAIAQDKPQQSCSAGSCSKKERFSAKQASCSKKDSGAASSENAQLSKKEANCSKKEASCSKKISE